MGNQQTTTSTCSSEVKLSPLQVLLLGDNTGTAWLLRRLGAKQSSLFVPLAHEIKHIVEDPRGDRLQASIILKIRNSSEFKFYHLPMFYKIAEAAIIVYDVAKKESHNTARMWLRDLKKNGRTDIAVILIGYSMDELDNKAIDVMKIHQSYTNETGILLHVGLNTECHAVKLHEIMMEMTRAVIAMRSYTERNMKENIAGALPPTLVELERGLKISPPCYEENSSCR